MKTLFVTSGPLTWASSRLRMFWPARYMENTDVIEGKDFEVNGDYDNYVFQKWVNVENLITLNEMGKRIFWDLCDPLHWFDPAISRKIADLCERVVCSSQALADDFNSWYTPHQTFSEPIKAICIIDRLELEHYPIQRKHADVSPVRLIWYGIAANRIGLYGGLATMERLAANGHKVELTIMDDRPDVLWRATNAFPIYHVLWELEKENEIIANHDIALLPPYPGPWGLVKSNNKALTAWACGLPETDGKDYRDIEMLLDWQLRVDHIQWNYQALCNLYNVEQSAREWEGLLNVH